MMVLKIITSVPEREQNVLVVARVTRRLYEKTPKM
jgi:hypothetical protein